MTRAITKKRTKGGTMRLLIFLGLKILEIVGFILAFSLFIVIIMPACFWRTPEMNFFPHWVKVVANIEVVLLGLGGFLGITYLLTMLIKSNWEKAGELENKWRKR